MNLINSENLESKIGNAYRVQKKDLIPIMGLFRYINRTAAIPITGTESTETVTRLTDETFGRMMTLLAYNLSLTGFSVYLGSQLYNMLTK